VEYGFQSRSVVGPEPQHIDAFHPEKSHAGDIGRLVDAQRREVSA
jgi:hypothetical protein